MVKAGMASTAMIPQNNVGSDAGIELEELTTKGLDSV